MSVINKMLRDLDQRQAGVAAAPALHGVALAGDTVPLPRGAGPLRSAAMRRYLVGGAGLLLSVGVALGLGYMPFRPAASPSPVAVAVPLPPVAHLAPAPAPVAAVSATVVSSPARDLSPTAAVQEAPQPMPDRVQESRVVRRLVRPTTGASRQSPQVKSSPAAVVQPVADTRPFRMDMTLSKPPVTAPLRAPALEGNSATSALAQAQALWQAGSRVAAMELVQQALDKVQASSTTALPATSTSALAQLARELARMNLAEGQVRQALALLTRLEPQLSQIADVWAMRGNAAQRLGQHTEAVKSYSQALLLHPDEPRWLSGQAVSLAAQGQLAAAGQLADKARALGGLQPEVASYLRQLGVALRID